MASRACDADLSTCIIIHIQPEGVSGFAEGYSGLCANAHEGERLSGVFARTCRLLKVFCRQNLPLFSLEQTSVSTLEALRKNMSTIFIISKRAAYISSERRSRIRWRTTRRDFKIICRCLCRYVKHVNALTMPPNACTFFSASARSFGIVCV
jgi:hypothetical protein